MAPDPMLAWVGRRRTLHLAVQESGMFPDTNTNWQAFFEVQKLILKNAGKVYASQPACPAPILAYVPAL